MKNKRFLATSFLIVLLSAAPAWAGHVVWVDFSNFDLKLWDFVNGHNPPQTSDLEAIKELIIDKMSQDYATFDITITTSKPANGRYTWVRVVGLDGLGVFGSVAIGDGGTGRGSWEMMVSTLVVYAGTFSTFVDFTGPNATTARIANAISGSASHELGHILGLEHCHAVDDWFEIKDLVQIVGDHDVECDKGLAFARTNTKDVNMLWHIMSSGESWELTNEHKAVLDRYFSAHSERRVLASALQLRNHFAPLANVNGGKGAADLVYGRLSSDVMQWFTRLSSGSDFFNFSEWSSGAGNPNDIFLTGDVDGDGRADLVYGRIKSSTQVTWRVHQSNGSDFGGANVWSADAGDAGDIFRLADVDDNGQADLVYGRPLDQNTVRWFARESNGSSFGNASIWANDAGDIGDLFFLTDVEADGDADLVYARAVPSSTQVKWFVRRSDGSKFGTAETWKSDAGNPGDLMYVGDADGDGNADLVYGRVKGREEVTWYFRAGSGEIFGDVETWADNAGHAGDLFRLGDTTGDGKLDLMYGRPRGLTSLKACPNLTLVRWYGRSSEETNFGSETTWANDAGDEGDCFP